MATLRYWLSTARDELKKRSAFLAKPLGIDLLSKEQTDVYLHPYQIAESPASRILLPRTMDAADPSKLIFDQVSIETGHTHVWKLDRISQKGSLLRSGGIRIGSKILNTDFGTNAFFKDVLKLKKRSTYAASTLIAPWSHYWSGYYDYLFFVVAKICRIKDTLPDSLFHEATIAYPLLHTAFERDLLDLLGVQPEQLLDSRIQTVQFSTVMLGDTNNWFYPNPADVLSIKKHITQAMPVQASSPKRIYIRRSGRRQVLNEDALITVLAKYNFDIIEDKPRSIAEQFAIYSNASFIMGPHGASFANLLWCKPGIHLLELFADNYIPEYFRYLAQLLGIHYSAYCHGTPGGSHHSHVNDDITISVDQLDRYLNDLLSQETIPFSASPTN